MGGVAVNNDGTVLKQIFWLAATVPGIIPDDRETDAIRVFQPAADEVAKYSVVYQNVFGVAGSMTMAL